PAFRIALPLRRKPFLVVTMECGEEEIDPKVYVDRGFGFREADAVAIAPGRSFAIRADVGRYGLIRAPRVDPATSPARFTFTARAFASAVEADAHIRSLADEAGAGPAVVDLGRLPRLKLPLPRLSLRRKGGLAARYANACYALAQAQAPA